MNSGIELKDILEYIKKNDFETYLEYNNLKNELEKDIIEFNNRKSDAKSEFFAACSVLPVLGKEIENLNIKIQNIESEIIRNCSSMEEYQNKQQERKELIDKVNILNKKYDIIRDIKFNNCYINANDYYNNIIKPKKQRLNEIERTFSNAGYCPNCEKLYINKSYTLKFINGVDPSSDFTGDFDRGYRIKTLHLCSIACRDTILEKLTNKYTDVICKLQKYNKDHHEESILDVYEIFKPLYRYEILEIKEKL